MLVTDVPEAHVLVVKHDYTKLRQIQFMKRANTYCGQKIESLLVCLHIHVNNTSSSHAVIQGIHFVLELRKQHWQLPPSMDSGIEHVLVVRL